jgi:hypothetical protein
LTPPLDKRRLLAGAKEMQGPTKQFYQVRRQKVGVLRHAVLQVRERGDDYLVGQDRPPRPELNRLGLGLGLFGERDDLINRLLRS